MVRSFAVASLHQGFDGRMGMDMITKRRRRSDQRVTVGLAMMAAILSFMAVQEVAGGASAVAAQQSPVGR